MQNLDAIPIISMIQIVDISITEMLYLYNYHQYDADCEYTQYLDGILIFSIMGIVNTLDNIPITSMIQFVNICTT